MGLQLADLTEEVAQRLELNPSEKGALVVRVSPGGIALESGLLRGMLIVAVENQPIASAKEFEEAIKDKSLDEGISLLVKIPRVGRQFIILKRR